MQQIKLDNISIAIEKKDIKNIYLRVYPPNGRVKISAPRRMVLDTILAFAMSKLEWIKKQQATFKNKKYQVVKEYISQESHYFRGERYLLEVIEQDAKPKVVLSHSKIELFIRPNTTREKRKVVIEQWYRAEMQNIIPLLMQKWEREIGVKANEFGIKKMRTKWGTCNPQAKRIWLNLELAKYPLQCLEYIIVHELTHFLERKHNDRFTKYMDCFMPQWRCYKDDLNRLPF